MSLQTFRHVHDIILLLFVCSTLAYYEFDENSLNVGTVLFSNADVEKNRWSQKEIGLLRARRYFQKLIPPPHFLRTADEHYVNDLLQYFKETYSSIKRDATDPEADQIMTTALSDAIGGYLKEWVLPITKYAFYGGTVSEENVVKIFNFYDELKRYLNTDGQGWRRPNLDLLTSTTINVASPKRFTERNKQNPCEKLAYFEQTPSGLSVPMPYVNWNEKSSTMFVPLKNQSLISLNVPGSKFNPLIRYYDEAKQCTETINSEDDNDFDGKFQVWLCKDIIPHLNDDQVYLGLGNVLSLVDRSEEKCKHIDKTETKPSCCLMKRISKKMIIIITLLFIEAAWCIPAILILLRKKMKKSPSKSESSDENYSKSTYDTNSNWTNTVDKVTIDSNTGSDQINTRSGIKIFKKHNLHNVALDTKLSKFVSQHSIGTESQLNYSSKLCSTSVLNVVNESPAPHEKASIKKMPSQNKINKNTLKDKCPEFHDSNNITVHEEINEVSLKVVCKGINDSQIKNTEEENRCLCLPCVKNDTITEHVSVPKYVKLKAKQTDVQGKATRLRFQREINCKDGKLKSVKPYVEVTIDRPQKEITVGFGNNMDSVELPKPVRPSRIPKLAHKSPNKVAGPLSPGKTPNQATININKSLIPQLNKESTDDIAIKNNKASTDNKLNVTM